MVEQKRDLPRFSMASQCELAGMSVHISRSPDGQSISILSTRSANPSPK